MKLGYLVESNGYSPEVFTDWDVLLNYLKKLKQPPIVTPLTIKLCVLMDNEREEDESRDFGCDRESNRPGIGGDGSLLCEGRREREQGATGVQRQAHERIRARQGDGQD